MFEAFGLFNVIFGILDLSLGIADSIFAYRSWRRDAYYWDGVSIVCVSLSIGGAIGLFVCLLVLRSNMPFWLAIPGFVLVILFWYLSSIRVSRNKHKLLGDHDPYR